MKARELKKHFQALIQQRIEWKHNDDIAIDKYRRILKEIEELESLQSTCFRREGVRIK